MSVFVTREPKVDFFEKAHLGRRFHLFPDVTVTYDTRSGSSFNFFPISVALHKLFQID